MCLETAVEDSIDWENMTASCRRVLYRGSIETSYRNDQFSMNKFILIDANDQRFNTNPSVFIRLHLAIQSPIESNSNDFIHTIT